MKLEDLQVYSQSIDLAERIWPIVGNLDFFSKDTLGKQLIRAADSVSANISEGFGRFHYRDNINFLYYSRGSLYETKTWLLKAMKRGLIDLDVYKSLIADIDDLGVRLNHYIRSIGKTSDLSRPIE